MEDIEVPLVRVDVGVHDFIKKRLTEVELPALYVVKKNKYYWYPFEWEVSPVMKFMTDLQDTVPVLETLEQVDDFLYGDGLRILGTFYDEERDKESPFAEFQEA